MYAKTICAKRATSAAATPWRTRISDWCSQATRAPTRLRREQGLHRPALARLAPAELVRGGEGRLGEGGAPAAGGIARDVEEGRRAASRTERLRIRFVVRLIASGWYSATSVPRAVTVCSAIAGSAWRRSSSSSGDGWGNGGSGASVAVDLFTANSSPVENHLLRMQLHHSGQ